MLKKLSWKRKEEPQAASRKEARPLPEESEGFICPICMEALRSAEALQVHWEAAHSRPTDGATEEAHSNSTNVPQRAVAAAVVRKPEHYLPTVLEEGADELEHYKLQVKIMADIVNEERGYSYDLRTEVSKLEATLESSGDQTREELRTVRQMFEQSEQSRSAMTSELVRLTTENSHLREDKQRLETASEKISSKAGTLAVSLAGLQSRLDDSQAKVEGQLGQIGALQVQLKEQELRNERLSVKLQQRPEADDVRAMQQQLSSLHVLLEQSTAEHESSLQQVVGERDRLAEEGGRLQTQLISSQEERAALPSREQLARLETEVASLLEGRRERQQEVARLEALLAHTQDKYDSAPKPELLERYKADVERLTADLSEGKTALTERDRQVASLQAELKDKPNHDLVSRLGEELRDVKDQLQQKRNEIKMLESSSQRLQSSLDRSPKQQDVENRDAQIRQLELELAAAPKQEKLERLEQEVRALQEQLNAAPKQQQLDSVSSSVAVLEGSLAAARAQLHEREVACSTLQQHATQLQSEEAKRTAVASSLRAELEQNQQDRHDKEVLLATRVQEVKQLKKQIAQLESKAETRAARVAQLEGEVGEQRAWHSQLQLERTELLTKIEAGEGASTAISQLEQEKRSLQGKLEAAYLSAEGKEREHELKRDAATSKHSQLSEQLDALREQVHSLEGQLQRKELALSASQGSLELLSAELRSKEAGWEERGREAARLHSQLSGEQDTLKGELAQTRTDNEALHSSTEQLKQGFAAGEREGRERLQRVQDEAQRQLQELSASLQAKASLLEDSASQLSELRMASEIKVLSVEKQLADKEQLLQNTQENVKKLEARVCEVERLETELREDKTVLERRCGEGEVTVRTLHDQIVSLTNELQIQARALESQIQQHDVTRQQLEVKLSSEVKLHEELGGLNERTESQEIKLKAEAARLESLEHQTMSLTATLKQKTEYASTLESQLELKQEMLQALQTDVERWQRDFERKGDEHEEREEQLRQELEFEQEKIEALELELDGARRDFKELHTQLDDADGRIATADGELETSRQQLDATREELNQIKSTLSEEVVELDKKLTDEKHYSGTLHRHKTSLEEKLKMTNAQLSETTQIKEACELEIERLQQQHHDRKAEWSRERLQLQEERDELSLQSRDTHSRLTLASEAATQVKQELLRKEAAFALEKKQVNDKLTALNGELAMQLKQLQTLRQEKVQSDKKHQTEIAALGSNLGSVRQQLESSRKKVVEAEAANKMHLARIADVTRSNKSLQDEHRALLEKCLAEEESRSSLQQQVARQQRHISELEAGLQELGREHQKLQIVQSRDSQRTWEKDHDAIACNKCNKRFSVTVRKHHCRRCGHIFCQQCASNVAVLPASKKSVRVCDSCTSQLTSN